MATKTRDESSPPGYDPSQFPPFAVTVTLTQGTPYGAGHMFPCCDPRLSMTLGYATMSWQRRSAKGLLPGDRSVDAEFS